MLFWTYAKFAEYFLSTEQSDLIEIRMLFVKRLVFLQVNATSGICGGSKNRNLIEILLSTLNENTFQNLRSKIRRICVLNAPVSII